MLLFPVYLALMPVPFMLPGACSRLPRSHGCLAQLGYTNTYIIGTLALPTFIFLFYAAIKKGQAEVDEDDARFRSGF